MRHLATAATFAIMLFIAQPICGLVMIGTPPKNLGGLEELLEQRRQESTAWNQKLAQQQMQQNHQRQLQEHQRQLTEEGLRGLGFTWRQAKAIAQLPPELQEEGIQMAREQNDRRHKDEEAAANYAQKQAEALSLPHPAEQITDLEPVQEKTNDKKLRATADEETPPTPKVIEAPESISSAKPTPPSIAKKPSQQTNAKASIH